VITTIGTVHNQTLQDKYDTDVKQKEGKVSDDKLKEDEDATFYGFKDGTSGIGTLAGTGLDKTGDTLPPTLTVVKE